LHELIIERMGPLRGEDMIVYSVREDPANRRLACSIADRKIAEYHDLVRTEGRSG